MARLTMQMGSRSESNKPAAFGRGASCAREESLVRYPKPVDLCVGKLKPSEREVEDCTDTDVQIVRMTGA